MTDSTGIIQFSKIAEPDIQSGYTADDNARALIVALGMERQERMKLIHTYIHFLKEAQNPDGSWNNLKLNGRFVTSLNSEDSLGRSVLAASFAADCGLVEIEDNAIKMLNKALPKAVKVKSPRAEAYVLLGLLNLISNKQAFSLTPEAKRLADKLMTLYEKCRTPGWFWFEEKLTYCNALLPHSLFGYYILSHDSRASKIAKESLDFLTDSLFKKGYLNIVGNRGWWQKENEIPPFDQQPVDAASIVLACLQAYIATREHQYITKAKIAYDWYWGKNIHQIAVYNEETEGCHDAIVPDGLNLNQGAEAVISFLMAHQVLQEVKKNQQARLIPAV